MRNLVWLFFPVLLFGCASKKVIDVDSNPRGARVEVNGITVCNSTPCQFTYKAACRNMDFQAPVHVEALPTRELATVSGNSSLFSDEKVIQPCEIEDKASLFFDLTTRRVAPEQDVNLSR